VSAAVEELERLEAGLTAQESDLIQLVLLRSRCSLGGPFLDMLRRVTGDT
jgi:hypothetical protein